MSGNFVALKGRLTKDAETTEVGDKTVTNFVLAHNRHWTARDGAEKEEVAFVPCSIWNWRGPALLKGMFVDAEGRLKTDSWTAKDGTPRSKLCMAVMSLFIIQRFDRAVDVTGDAEARVE